MTTWGHFAKVDRLKDFVAGNRIDRRVSLFWHGTSAEPAPRINGDVFDLIQYVGGPVEVDFDRGDLVPPRGASEAA